MMLNSRRGERRWRQREDDSRKRCRGEARWQGGASEDGSKGKKVVGRVAWVKLGGNKGQGKTVARSADRGKLGSRVRQRGVGKKREDEKSKAGMSGNHAND